jgi:hypothetical protein
MKRKLQTPEARRAKLVAKRLEALLEAIDECSEAGDAKGLSSDLAAFGPVLEMLQDVVSARVPLDRGELSQWTDALTVMEYEGEEDYEDDEPA